jgi:glycosyltransferase involved in cell wall biosynthesis
MKIAYLVGRADAPSETFIRREIAAISELGAEVLVQPTSFDPGFVCPWCVLGKHVWLSMLPRTWRAVARFPFGDLVRLRLAAWREFIGGLDMASAYAKGFRRAGVEHIHAHFGTKPAAIGSMAAAMTGLPFTLSVHARDVFVEGVGLAKKVAAAQAVAVCSRAAERALFDRLPPELQERVVLVRHGIDISAYAFRESWEPHERLRLLAAGRFVEKKGFTHLIDAVAKLPGVTCSIAGDGPLDGLLRKQAGALGIADRVSFRGWLPADRLREQMAEADLFVAPSVLARDGDRDGVPNVLLEAGALGLPIIACDAGGVGEFVLNDETGRLVPPGNADALAGAIRSAVATPDTTRRFAAAARAKVESEYELRENARLLMKLFSRPGVLAT